MTELLRKETVSELLRTKTIPALSFKGLGFKGKLVQSGFKRLIDGDGRGGKTTQCCFQRQNHRVLRAGLIALKVFGQYTLVSNCTQNQPKTGQK